MHKIFIIILFIISTITLQVKANNNNGEGKDRLADNLTAVNVKEVGRAKFSFLFWDIYNSILYTKSGHYLPEKPSPYLLFEIEYLKDITATDLLERTIEQWQHLSLTETQYAQFIPVLEGIWPDISAGDKLALFVQNDQSTFYFNGVKIGFVEQKEFSKLFLDIWLSKKTSQPELRDELLRGNSHE